MRMGRIIAEQETKKKAAIAAFLEQHT